MRKWISLVILAATGASAQIDVNRTVMTVNGEEVKGTEYYRRMEFLTGVGMIVNNTFAQAPPGFLTLQRLLDERLLLQLAKSKGVLPAASEVKAELARRMEEDPKAFEEFTKSGFTIKDFEYRTLMDLAEFKLETQGITITDLELEKFYAANPGIFTEPKRFRLRVIAVDTDAKRTAVDADLQAGKPFPEVAKQHSIEASKSIGGLLGDLAENQLATAALKAVQTTKIGHTTDWIKDETYSTKFYLEDVIPLKKQQYDAKLKRDLRHRLMIDRGRVKNDLTKDMRAMRAKSNVVILEPQFVEAIKTYIETAKQGG